MGRGGPAECPPLRQGATAIASATESPSPGSLTLVKHSPIVVLVSPVVTLILALSCPFSDLFPVMAASESMDLSIFGSLSPGSY
jgi:hypothetical protein